jgi:hypothetical protein
MKLQTYMRLRRLTANDVAGALKVTPHGVRRWLRRTRVPDEESLMALYIWSEGAVTPNDFYPLKTWDAFVERVRPSPA